LSYIVAAIYKFADLDQHEALRRPLLDVMRAHGVRGSILIAHEGINGTIAGTREGIDHVLTHLESDPRLAGLSLKESSSDKPPFSRTKVKLKKEIVTMGVDVDAQGNAGTYVEPADWNALISDPDVVLIDTRNAYEVEVEIGRASCRERV